MPMAGTTPLRDEEKVAMPTGKLSTPEPTMAFTRLMVEEKRVALPCMDDGSPAAAAATSAGCRCGGKRRPRICLVVGTEGWSAVDMPHIKASVSSRIGSLAMVL